MRSRLPAGRLSAHSHGLWSRGSPGCPWAVQIPRGEPGQRITLARCGPLVEHFNCGRHSCRPRAARSPLAQWTAITVPVRTNPAHLTPEPLAHTGPGSRLFPGPTAKCYLLGGHASITHQPAHARLPRSFFAAFSLARSRAFPRLISSGGTLSSPTRALERDVVAGARRATRGRTLAAPSRAIPPRPRCAAATALESAHGTPAATSRGMRRNRLPAQPCRRSARRDGRAVSAVRARNGASRRLPARPVAQVRCACGAEIEGPSRDSLFDATGG